MQVFLGYVVAEEMQQAVKEHGAVTRGEYESVAVIPLGVVIAEVQKICENFEPYRRRAHTYAGVTGLCLLYAFGGKDSESIYALGFNGHFVFSFTL